MDIVLILGNDRLSLTQLSVKGSKIKIIDSTTMKYRGINESLGSAEAATDFLKSLFDTEKVSENKFYVVFAPGSGLAYKTWQSAAASFNDVTDKTFEAKEERILALCMDNIPDGLTLLHDRYVTSVVSCYEDDTSTVTSAYIPYLYLENLKAACSAVAITLFKVSDVASSLKNIVNVSDGQVFLESNRLICAFNEFGAMAWLIPANRTDNMVDIFASMTEKFFPLQNAVRYSRWAKVEKSFDYLKITLSGAQTGSFEDAVIAAGCVYDAAKAKAAQKNVKQEDEAKEGGGKENVISKLRKLFKKK